MRKRSIQVIVRLNEREHETLLRHSRKSGLSQSAYVRSLITGNAPKETPPLEYYMLMRELHAIGTNINQIAKAANASGEVNTETFATEASNLRAALLTIQRAIELPVKLSGNH